MTKQLKELYEQALRLAPEERAKLAADLIASLDGPPDPDAEAAWVVEIERRARRALAGEMVGSPWKEVKERLHRKLHG